MSDVPWKELEKRAKARGPSCEAILDKWAGYEDDGDLREITEPWEDQMRTAQEVETQYRAALDECATRAGGELVQMRCLTDRAELRADMDQRVVAGVAVRYGDEARIYSFRERIARGALTLPTAPANLNRQHDRAIPLGLMEWIDDEDALRFRVTLPPGMAQDQALSDVSHGLLRGPRWSSSRRRRSRSSWATARSTRSRRVACSGSPSLTTEPTHSRRCSG